MARQKPGAIKPRRATSGETLVETIVSFAMVMLILMAVNTIIGFSTSMARRAMDTAAALEEHIAHIEQDGPAQGAGNDTFRVQFGDQWCSQGVVTRQQGPIDYFLPADSQVTP